ncbi:MAG: aspartate/glutamate racemase family protein [Clostridia bacterium]|nr:aspartate/glutamate racemase family protein [Clostridia bacterium]
MKTIGIIGGMSYESSAHYYQKINNQVNAKAGGLNSAKIILYSVNLEEITALMRKGDWDKIGEEIAGVAKILENAGADYIAMASNTIHKVADRVEKSVGVPLIHIADCVADKCKKSGAVKVGLLGTKYTMTEDFLKRRLALNGLTVITPADDAINELNRIIFDELCKGVIKDGSRDYYVKVINDMIKSNGIEGVIFGCTELEMLVKKSDLDIPIFDTTQSHVDGIVDLLLKKD